VSVEVSVEVLPKPRTSRRRTDPLLFRNRADFGQTLGAEFDSLGRLLSCADLSVLARRTTS